MEDTTGTEWKAVPETLGDMAPTHEKLRDTSSGKQEGQRTRWVCGIHGGILLMFSFDGF